MKKMHARYHERVLALTQDADSERPAMLAARAYIAKRGSTR